MTSCSKCANRRDCWIKSICDGKKAPSGQRDIDLAISAMSGRCCCFEDREDSE